MQITAFGHPNITATHETTLEITATANISIEGNCIIAVKAQFNTVELQKLVEISDRINMTITAGAISDTLEARVNKRFNDLHEIVIRLSDFASNRTLGVRANKAAVHLKKELVEQLKKPEQEIIIQIDAL